jgi:hypothetical protein
MVNKYKVIIFIVVIAIVFPLGIYTGLQNIKNNTTYIRNTIPPKITSDMVIDQLFANIKGTIIEKGSDYLVVKDGENSIKAYYDKNGISTFVVANTTSEIKLESLKVGDIVATGGISIFVSSNIPGGETGRILIHYWQINQK